MCVFFTVCCLCAALLLVPFGNQNMQYCREVLFYYHHPSEEITKVNVEDYFTMCLKQCQN